MRNWELALEKWEAFKQLDPALRTQLDNLAGNREALEEAFYKELTFGTGGMRGVLGPGTNRMNIYTVRKAVDGLARFLLFECVNVKDRGVVVAYDSRYMSQEFAVETAKVLGAYGIKAYVFESLRPTPLLSYAVRYFGAVAGVMITASHNPPEYNGFKVYNETGGQMVPQEADKVIAKIQEVENELLIPVVEAETLEAEGLLYWIGDEVDNAYLDQLALISKMKPTEMEESKDLGIVFTPLHGTGHHLVMRGLEQLHFENVNVVAEQAVPDPEFSTVDSPNPEEHQAFAMAMKQGIELQADILLGTDPDADRLGVAVKDQTGSYKVLTGNQLGSLLIDYILSHTEPVLLKNGRVLKTIVTTQFGQAIAKSYGVETMDTLTGFKYIAEKIRHFDETGETFMFGFEESYGYLISSFVRDKDAIQAAVMACEMAHYWKKKGKTLLEALDLLKEKHGYFLEGMSSLTLKGIEGSRQIAHIMESFRKEKITNIAGLTIENVEDYLAGERNNLITGSIEEIELPKENVLKFNLENNSWVCLRPSGTEPKIKCYYGVCSTSNEESEASLAKLKKEMDEQIQALINA
ncbi:phospho-sugar mutase [Virgibacillus sp. MG-45]|uniref:phospho-sugar mutase n=1 Tax=Virgibacillus sp. MG-45 TaxID=3102791 RepID=UPI002ED95431